MGCYAVSTGKELLTICRCVLLSSAGAGSLGFECFTLKMDALRFFDVGKFYRATLGTYQKKRILLYLVNYTRYMRITV